MFWAHKFKNVSNLLILRQTHRVGRVLGFFSSRWNWDSPDPPVLGGGTHTLAREGLGDSQFRWGDIHCGTLYITYFVLQTLATILNFRKNCYAENIRILQYTYCDFRQIFMTVWTTEDWEHPERFYFLLLKKMLWKKFNQMLIMQYVSNFFPCDFPD